MNSFLKHSMQRQSFDAVPKLRLLENQSRLFPASVHRTLVATLAGAAIAIGSAHCGIGHNALGTFNGADETNTDLSLLTLLLAAPPASGSSRTTSTQIVAGRDLTCYLSSAGTVHCWGRSDQGQLGYGNTNDIGDDELPAAAGTVDVGGNVTQLTAGGSYACALLDTGSVRCWGYGIHGRLGYANTNNIGDNEAPATAGNVNIGGLVTQISGRYTHTCALLDNGSVRCWGSGFVGALGYGNTNNIGDDEMPATAGDVNVGGPVTQVATGEHHNCVILSNGFVRCWGRSQFGQMGYGDTNIIGDNPGEMPPGDVQVFE